MKIRFILFLVFLGNVLSAQELRATIKVLSPEVQATNKDIFTALETSLDNFLNGNSWTDYKYADEERIECSFILTVKSLNSNK
ncbi:MAG TPA: DUF4835 domain-containing protein, partial [Cryomorphaceae bacterium]|nr:DUF4835 domain-containing protein [Cryomorphaceae bacterium]